MTWIRKESECYSHDKMRWKPNPLALHLWDFLLCATARTSGRVSLERAISEATRIVREQLDTWGMTRPLKWVREQAQSLIDALLEAGKPLHERGLLELDGDGILKVHDFADYNFTESKPSSDTVRETPTSLQKRRAEAGRAGAAKRWANGKPDGTDSKSQFAISKPMAKPDGKPVILPPHATEIAEDSSSRNSANPAADTRIPCPADLALTPDQITQLSMAGKPYTREELTEYTATFRMRALGGDERRTLKQWRSSLVSALTTDWPKVREARNATGGTSGEERRRTSLELVAETQRREAEGREEARREAEKRKALNAEAAKVAAGTFRAVAR